MPDMLTTERRVSGMTCDHCEDAVKDEVSALDSVVDVQVDVPAGRVTVTSTTPLDDARVREAIDEAGSERTGRAGPLPFAPNTSPNSHLLWPCVLNGEEKVRAMRRLGDLEAEIMDRLWTWNRPATVREVVDDINKIRPIAYTTVMTVTNILYNKGWLLRGKQGRAWLYSPVRSREAYAAALMEDGLGESKDRPAALVHFVENMSKEEQAALRKALRAVGRQAKAEL